MKSQAFQVHFYFLLPVQKEIKTQMIARTIYAKGCFNGTKPIKSNNLLIALAVILFFDKSIKKSGINTVLNPVVNGQNADN
ncbi:MULTISPECIES: hypothetical protein [unclassified Myroides]|uniref:hypothetical protein n=1 Tax=unclassified Myroides TaxID=2642485 RepID=UPI003D2F9B2C